MRHAVIVSFYSDLIPRHHLMKETLAQNGWRVSTIVWDRAGKTVAGAGGNTVVGVPAGSQSASMLVKMPLLYRRILRELEGLRPDMLLITHYFLLPVAAMVSGSSTVKVYDAPEYFCMDIPEYFGALAGPAGYPVRLLERILAGSVHGVLAVDSRDGWFADYYRKMGKQVEVILNVPAANRPVPEDDKGTVDRHVDINRKIVAYAGSLKVSKGVLTALQAASLVRMKDESVLFEFIGPWHKGSEEIEAEVKRLNLQHHVRFTGPCSYGKMLARLSSARVGLALLQGERYEYSGPGNSRKIFAYMQAGLPVIASGTGVACSLVEATGSGMLVDANSPESVAEAIRIYLVDRELAKKHGDSGRNAFEKTYNWETEQQKFTSFINGLMHTHESTA